MIRQWYIYDYTMVYLWLYNGKIMIIHTMVWIIIQWYKGGKLPLFIKQNSILIHIKRLKIFLSWQKIGIQQISISVLKHKKNWIFMIKYVPDKCVHTLKMVGIYLLFSKNLLILSFKLGTSAFLPSNTRAITR